MYFWAGVEDLSQFPHLKSWMSRIEERDAVKKGIDVPEKSKYNPNDSKEEHEKQAKEASKWIMQDQKK
jgi:glutathione S-transferase